MRKFLALKHWQLFLLIIVCGAWTSPSPLKEIVNSIAVVSFSCWIYALGVVGQKKVKASGLKSMHLGLFTCNIIFIIAFFFINLIFFTGSDDLVEGPFLLKDLPLVAARFYLIFAIFQTIIFACKTITEIEYRKEVSFPEYFSNFFLIFFFFAGIWVLQPKVNNLYQPSGEMLQ